MSETAVAAALVNWNGMDYLERCLAALAAQTRPLDQVVLVDNGSVDGSKEWVRQHHPGVEILENERNEGFAAGYNRALAACATPYILMLNNDVFVEADFVEQALKGLGADVGAVTGRVYQAGTDEVINGGFFPRRQIRMLPSANLEQEEMVFGCTGAVVLFRRETLESARVEGEYFDETYFSYGEDLDLAWRLQLFGWKARYQPQARAYHVGSGSLGGRLRFLDKPALFQRHVLKNRYLTVVKNASAGVFWYLLPWLLLCEVLIWPYLLVRCPRRLPYLLGAWVDVLRLLPQTLRKRRQIQRQRRVSSRYIRGFFAHF